jgi:hypothetical protein
MRSLTIFMSGPVKRRIKPSRSSALQVWFTDWRGAIPVRADSWSSSSGFELIPNASKIRSRLLCTVISGCDQRAAC